MTSWPPKTQYKLRTIQNELAALKQVTETGLFTDFAVVVEMASDVYKGEANDYNIHVHTLPVQTSVTITVQ